MAKFHDPSEFPSKQARDKLVQSKALSYFKDHLMKKMKSYSVPSDEHLDNAGNQKDDYGELDDTVTIDGVEVTDAPQFDESKLYNNSIDAKIENKKHVYGLLAAVLQHMDFIEEISKDSVAVYIGDTTAEPRWLNLENRGHLYSHNIVNFENSIDEANHSEKLTAFANSNLKHSIDEIIAKTPDDGDLHDHLDGYFNRVTEPDIAASADKKRDKSTNERGR